ncbi:MAG: branched-chain amino acid ABC transporter permease [Candidatus Diapherotrites archaeon]|nr:branched-chain amino acid ABC transporter permease [Candidatus Diapherotrites archaeon]
MVFTQLLFNGLIAGAIYALVASGFSLIYSTNKFVHFAHGSVVAFGAYILFTLFAILHLDFALAILLTIVFSALFGVLLNRVYGLLRKRHASSVILLIASLALLILLESVILAVFGAEVKTIDVIPVARGLDFLGAIITPLQIVIIIVSLVLLAGLFLFLKYTKMGKALRAVADNPEKAEIVGISSQRMFDISFAIGSGIAGVAGILVGLEQNLEPTMGTALIIKGFTGAVVGGITSVPGAILGSFLLGLSENFGIWFLPSGYKDAIAFVILFVFLLLRPQGILGVKGGIDD